MNSVMPMHRVRAIDRQRLATTAHAASQLVRDLRVALATADPMLREALARELECAAALAHRLDRLLARIPKCRALVK